MIRRLYTAAKVYGQIAVKWHTLHPRRVWQPIAASMLVNALRQVETMKRMEAEGRFL